MNHSEHRIAFKPSNFLISFAFTRNSQTSELIPMESIYSKHLPNNGPQFNI